MADLTPEQQLLMNTYFELMNKASMLIANNPTAWSFQARIRIEEALMWGRLAIQSFQPEPLKPEGEAPVKVSNEENQESPQEVAH